MLIGIGIGFISPLSSAILFSLFTDSYQRNMVIGWQGCGTAIGSIIATNLAGLLAGIDYHLAFLVHLIGLLTFLINLFFLPQDSLVKKKEKGKATSLIEIIKNINPMIVFWYFSMFFYMGYLNAFSTKISLLIESSGLGTSAVSALGITLLTVGSFTGGLWYGVISKQLRAFTTGCGIIISSLGLMFLAIGKNPAMVYLSGVFTGLGMSMTTPGFLVGVVEAANKENRTLAIAVNGVFSNLGLSLSPYLTAFTTSIFCGVGKTLRDEYFVSSIALIIMGIFGLVLSIRKIVRKTI